MTTGLRALASQVGGEVRLSQPPWDLREEMGPTVESRL